MPNRRLKFLGSASVLAIIGFSAQSVLAQTVTTHPAASTPAVGASSAASTAGSDATTLETIIVTGSTSRRTLLDTSVAVTAIKQADLDQKAPRGTDEILELVPGIFVEATAGPVSNNYSVRGLPGGSQQFIRLEEDGMPAIFGGLNDDEVFQYDLSIDHVEALEGGTSGILTENAAGASINFISRKLNFDHGGGIARVSGATYGDGRGDLWYSAPLPMLGPNVAFAVSGYYDSNPGVRSSPFRYDTYHVKGQLEKKFDGGGFVELTYKRWNEHDPYYADQPYAYSNGKISGISGLSTQSGNIIGKGFGSITVPDSCAANECTRTFSERQGIHEEGNEYRIDLEKPVSESFSVFAKARYTQTSWDFNGVFAGSGTGNAGLASAETYLTNTSASPIQSLLQQGLIAFPTATQFGIKNLTTGVVTAASNVAALNALNGNGLLQQTVLNRQVVKIRDWGSDFGAKWKTSGSAWTNSLTVGGMVYSQHLSNDQSGVSTVINDVKNDSNIYDIVALNSSNNVVGTLSNNGLIGYGDWGSGISSSETNSQSIYFNNEFTYADRLHIDFGLRYEHEKQTSRSGNSSSQAVPAGTPGLLQVNPNAFNGTYSYGGGSETPLNYTIGINYTVLSNLSVYGRYADAFQTQGENARATEIKLYEAGVTYSAFGVLGTVRGFRTIFDHQSFGGGVDPDNPNLNQGFFANSDTNGVDVDMSYRPTYTPLQAFSIHGQLTYQKSTFNNVSTGTISINGADISSQVDTFYDGKAPAQTPSLIYTITPQYDLPNHLGSVYARYKYIGSIFADNGNALALPGYGVLSLGGDFNVTETLNLNVSIDNVTNALGLTEGNPRQGFTQSVASGYFYGRGIVGTNAQVQLTYKF